MNRTFPAMLLKIERDSVLPGTCIPTGRNKRVEYAWQATLYDAWCIIRKLKKVPTVVRVTLICKEQEQGKIVFAKALIHTHGEPVFCTRCYAYQTQEERIARTAIIPAEVMREATRSAQS